MTHLFLFLLGFVAGWWAYGWWVHNDRNFDRAFVGPASEAIGEATRVARDRGATFFDRNGDAGTPTASRRARRS